MKNKNHPVTKSLLVVIVGQTASGKSALALELAERFEGEIICADSRTVYQGMDIGTAKPTKQEQALAPHHLLDIVRPDIVFTAADYKQRALACIDEIASTGKLPIMVGGTGLYIDAVLFDYSFATDSAKQSLLNPRHRATEAAGNRKPLRENTIVIGLETEKEILHQRIDRRVQFMQEQGLEDEVMNLADKYGWDAPGLNAIGYREWQKVFNQKTSSQADVLKEIVKNTKSYAKRQKTWFKRNKSIHWLSDPGEANRLVSGFLNK